jgi:hypothetical protein
MMAYLIYATLISDPEYKGNGIVLAWFILKVMINLNVIGRR